MPTITGTPSTSIAAQCTGPNVGKSPIAAGDVNGPFQSIENDLATIKSGDHTFGGNKQFLNDVDIGGNATVSGDIEVIGQSTFPGGVSGDVVVGGGDVYSPHYYFTSAPSVTRTGYSQPVNQSGSWAMTATNYWTDSSTGSVLLIPVDVPHGATLNTIRVYIDPAGSHGGVPTASIAFQKRVVATNASSTPAQTGGTEVSGSVGAYEACHALTLTLTGGHTIDRDNDFYYVLLTGEGGGNALANLTYVGIEYDYVAPTALGVG